MTDFQSVFAVEKLMILMQVLCVESSAASRSGCQAVDLLWLPGVQGLGGEPAADRQCAQPNSAQYPRSIGINFFRSLVSGDFVLGSPRSLEQGCGASKGLCPPGLHVGSRNPENPQALG